jgi:hypothetical protein
MLDTRARLPLAEVYTAGQYDLYDPTGRKFGLQVMCSLGDRLPYAPCGWLWAPGDVPTEAEEAQTMKDSSVDAASIADQACRCRRLAAGLPDGDTKATLFALAVEYESGVKPYQKRPETRRPRPPDLPHRSATSPGSGKSAAQR